MSRPSSNPRRDRARRYIQRGWLPLLLTMDLTGLNASQFDWQVSAGKLAYKVLRGVTLYSLSDVLRITGAASGPQLLDRHYPFANPSRKRKARCGQLFESHSSETKRRAFTARLERIDRYAMQSSRDVSKSLSSTEWHILNRLLFQANLNGRLTVCTTIKELQRHTGKKDPETMHRALRGLKGADILRIEKDGTQGSYLVTFLDPLTGHPFPDDLDTFTGAGIPARSSWEPAT